MRFSPHFLKYLHPEIFPAQRDTLISAAIKAGAPDEVLEKLGAVDSQEEFTLRRLAQALAETRLSESR
ncbi:hypothetical protein Rhe02_44500 [Rhizocola hellebori]|uniref:DUF2795 domain-containing protein n=1 Tax=Rhizocola hellebori TaxID=1392758 RepID=A0A8J3QAZ3_9ACTN|nr:DUF2795 domain-containing protein [Rhizocola hellebori]GIH06383.1 hypothetical protein Rhe02_44500 [Rhizocola hellebori]